METKALTTTDNKDVAVQPRVSGTGHDLKTAAGQAAVRHMKYSILNKDTGLHEIDVQTISDKIQAYIKENEWTKVIEENKKTGVVTEYKVKAPLSKVSIRIALDISRDTYNVWEHGYVRRSDMDDESVICNKALSDALRAGNDKVVEYLTINQSKYGQTKDIRFLETYGEIAPAKQQPAPYIGTLNLGIFERFAH